jgi:hypothetical protein
MKLEPLPLKLATLRWTMIRLVWRRGSWLERFFHIPEIWLTLRKRIRPGIVTIAGLWSEMSRFSPGDRRDEQIFLEFCQALPGGESLSEVIAQRILDELDRRKGLRTYVPGGLRLRLMDVSNVVAREFSGLLSYSVLPSGRQ